MKPLTYAPNLPRETGTGLYNEPGAACALDEARMPSAREAIYEALTNAYDGGYRADVTQHPDEVADDMADKDAAVERMLADKIITHADLSRLIAEWQKERDHGK